VAEPQAARLAQHLLLRIAQIFEQVSQNRHAVLLLSGRAGGPEARQ
jgi:hypothetical protein